MNWIQRYEYIKKHWPAAGWFLAVLFCYAWLTKKPEPLTIPAPLVVNQAQAVTTTAKASVQVRIVYKDRLVEVPGEAPRPLPCPDLDITADSGSEATHWQSQAVTVTPNLAPSSQFKGGLVLGAGYFGAPYGLVGLEHNHWRGYGQIGLGSYGGGVDYTLPLW